MATRSHVRSPFPAGERHQSRIPCSYSAPWRRRIPCRSLPVHSPFLPRPQTRRPAIARGGTMAGAGRLDVRDCGARDDMTTPPPSFAALLKGYRLAAGLTQEGLAARAGISAHAVSDLE